MNRLILVGNGFDLAHGMKTSYGHFIENYLQEGFKHALKNDSFEDDFVEIIRNRQLSPGYDISKWVMKDYISFIVDKKKHDNGRLYLHDQYTIKFYFAVKNDFIEKIIKDCAARWVDIENNYYQYLIKEIYQTTLYEPEKRDKLSNLNTTFLSLTEKIERYLDKQKMKTHSTEYSRLFREPIFEYDVVVKNARKILFPLEDINGKYLASSYVLPEFVKIVNFNYTKTIDYYLQFYKEEGIDAINIHGRTYDKDNQIIFGFGDELDDNYQLLEKENDRQYFRFVKSFGYAQTDNYHNLLRFIDSDYYQVYVLGHSCGLSDRTMLNMIFEHDNCLSIKIFYHLHKDDSTNFRVIIEEMSKHFVKKSNFRRKVLNFKRSSEMPQATHNIL